MNNLKLKKDINSLHDNYNEDQWFYGDSNKSKYEYTVYIVDDLELPIYSCHDFFKSRIY